MPPGLASGPNKEGQARTRGVAPLFFISYSGGGAAEPRLTSGGGAAQPLLTSGGGAAQPLLTSGGGAAALNVTVPWTE
jgi:hypothetical protein